ncbi:hypothetical protein BDZ45DRAFT_752462 [Acephala macrosclerotiorum]|nr:hypothetical protein BDZ45DRAFT_752462 [Acephala macrosclerotiorum]
MCVWSSISFGCGHHEAKTNECLRKKDAVELGNPFWHTTPCDFQEAYAEQTKSCPLCTAKIQAAISQGQQRQHVLGYDPRDTLPSKTGRKVQGASSAGPHPLLPLPRLASLAKKHKDRSWKASTEATALEWARLSALGLNIGLSDDNSILPADGIVKIARGDNTLISAEQIVDGVTDNTEDYTEHLWVAAAAHQRMCEIAGLRKREQQQEDQQRTVPHTIPRKAIPQQDLRTREKTGALRQEYRAAEPDQQSDSTLLGLTAIGELLPKIPAYTANQESAELFLHSKQHTEVERLPSCLVAGSTGARLSQMSADFEAARISRQEISSSPERQRYQALNLSKDVGRASNIPSIFVSMFDSQGEQQVAAPAKPTSVVVIASKPDASKHQSLPYQLPISKRISTLHFEGTILESLPLGDKQVIID